MLDFGNITTSTPQLQLVREWMEGYHSLDIKKVKGLTSKDFRFHCPFGDYIEPGEDHFSKYERLLSSMDTLDTKVEELFEAPGKVVIHATSVSTPRDGGDARKKGAICILSLGEEDGVLKILEAKEFADPKKDEAWCK